MKHIVILGGGFGGLQAALALSKKLKRNRLQENYSVVLADRNSFHTFTPLLYEIAVTSQETASDLELQTIVSFPLQKLLADTSVTLVQDHLVRVDLENKLVVLSKSKIEFVYLVIALGSEPYYYDIPGLDMYALPLKTFDDAIRIRDRIVSTFRSSRRNVRIVIGGGGPTGVELASEIRKWIPELKEECYNTCRAEITIVEATTRILASFDENVSQKAMLRLRKLGISILPHTRIARVDAKKTYFNDGKEKEYDILIWAGGVKANSAVDPIPLEKGMRGRIETNEYAVPNSAPHDFVFVIGDNAVLHHPVSGTPTPLMARPAILQGRIAAENIMIKILANECGGTTTEKKRRYLFRNYPYIIPLGGKYALAQIGTITFSGFVAWVFKGFTELNYFLSIMPFFTALGVWLKGLNIFIRNDRLG